MKLGAEIAGVKVADGIGQASACPYDNIWIIVLYLFFQLSVIESLRRHDHSSRSIFFLAGVEMERRGKERGHHRLVGIKREGAEGNRGTIRERIRVRERIRE